KRPFAGSSTSTRLSSGNQCRLWLSSDHIFRRKCKFKLFCCANLLEDSVHHAYVLPGRNSHAMIAVFKSTQQNCKTWTWIYSFGNFGRRGVWAVPRGWRCRLI